jgi:AcrR family transcriptional regulator
MSPVDTRSKLPNAAQEPLDEGGPAAVTLREVGRRSGVSHNAPSNHFDSKELLPAELAAIELTHLQEALARDLDGGVPPVDALERSIAEQVARAVAYPKRYRLICGHWESTEVLDGVALESSALRARTVADAQATGAIAHGEPERVSALLRAMVRGAAEIHTAGHLAADGNGHGDAADLVGDFMNLLRR